MAEVGVAAGEALALGGPYVEGPVAASPIYAAIPFAAIPTEINREVEKSHHVAVKVAKGRQMALVYVAVVH